MYEQLQMSLEGETKISRTALYLLPDSWVRKNELELLVIQPVTEKYTLVSFLSLDVWFCCCSDGQA